MAPRFLTHPLIGDKCVTPSESFVLHQDATGKKILRQRVGRVGCLVMLRPDDDEEVNPRGDKSWFGVLTWVQPEREVKKGRTRLCEVWWIYTKQHIIDLVEGSKSSEAQKNEIMSEVRKSHKKLAWVSNHFSDEPLDSIVTIPTDKEISERIKLSKRRYFKLDAENDLFDFIAMKA